MLICIHNTIQSSIDVVCILALHEFQQSYKSITETIAIEDVPTKLNTEVKGKSFDVQRYITPQIFSRAVYVCSSAEPVSLAHTKRREAIVCNWIKKL